MRILDWLNGWRGIERRVQAASHMRGGHRRRRDGSRAELIEQRCLLTALATLDVPSLGSSGTTSFRADPCDGCGRLVSNAGA